MHDLISLMVMNQKQINNFWAKVKKTKSCWNWIAATQSTSGYGKFYVTNDCYPAHRISLFLDGQNIQLRKKEKGAGGIIVMHTCDNRRCVNPKHLKIATQLENIRDSINKGTHFLPDWSGNNNPQSIFMRNKSLVQA